MDYKEKLLRAQIYESKSRQTVIIVGLQRTVTFLHYCQLRGFWRTRVLLLDGL